MTASKQLPVVWELLKQGNRLLNTAGTVVLERRWVHANLLWSREVEQLDRCGVEKHGRPARLASAPR